MLVVSFGLTPIRSRNGPIEIAPGTHKMDQDQALLAVQAGHMPTQLVPLEIGDVLIRHPWAGPSPGHPESDGCSPASVDHPVRASLVCR